MRRVRRISRKSKSFLAGLCIGSLLVGAIFVGWQRTCGRRDLVEFTSAQAKYYSEMLGNSLASGDKKDAYMILSLLRHHHPVVFAGLYNEQGTLFSAYFRSDIPPRNVRASESPETGVSFSDGYLKVSEPVVMGQKVIGKVCVWSER